MKKAIYTVITGNYDKVLPAPNFKGWDNILFTDNDVKSTWNVVKVKSEGNPLLKSRYYKICSHVTLKEYDLVCYIDGNQKFVKEPPPSALWFMHPLRRNINQEFDRVLEHGFCDEETLIQQKKYYFTQGYQDCGLYMNGFFIREHNEEINHLHDVWYKEFKRFQTRDQLSLPYAMWLTGITPMNITRAQIKYNYAHITQIHAPRPS